MAGDWMKVEVSLPDKAEVWAIADEIGIDPDAVVGKLFRVWRWFDAHTTNGNALSVTKKLLDREVGVTGFMDAMQNNGWLELDGNEVRIPNFDRHNSKSAKNRALGRKRVEKHRNAQSVTDALPEKRREETEKEVHTSTAARFDEWWGVYPKKVEKKKAKAIWKRRKLDAIADTLIADVEKRQRLSDKWKRGFIKNPTAYLNGDLWEDEIDAEPSAPPTIPKNDDACVRFAEQHGIHPNVGESMWAFRQRVENHLRTN